jgi:hypothetical protein
MPSSVADKEIEKLRQEATEHPHGHVRPRKDKSKARCGGPGLCPVCRTEKQMVAAGELPEKIEAWST